MLRKDSRSAPPVSMRSVIDSLQINANTQISGLTPQMNLKTRNKTKADRHERAWTRRAQNLKHTHTIQ